mgnify:CR=1 FL=1
MERLNLVPFSITYGVHAYISMDCNYSYNLIIHEDIQKILNVEKLEDIFIVDDDACSVPKVRISVEKFNGKKALAFYHFINGSSVVGVKVLMIPKKDYACIKMRL